MPLKAVVLAVTPLVVVILGLLGTQSNTNISKANK